jgi:hypothetical protein
LRGSLVSSVERRIARLEPSRSGILLTHGRAAQGMCRAFRAGLYISRLPCSEAAFQRIRGSEWGVTGELLGTSPLHDGGVEDQPRDVPAAFDAERERAANDGGGGGVLAEVWRTSALHSGIVASRADHVVPEVDRDGQLALFDLPGGDAIGGIDPQGRNGGHVRDAGETTGTGDALLDGGADRAVLGALEQTLASAREAGDSRPALVVLATWLGDLGRPSALAPAAHVSLRQARDEWLRRLDAQQKSESTLVGYRVAIDDLLDWSDAHGRDVLEESGIVDYLRSYRERASPAESTYYRRFVLLRSFLRWVSSRHGLPDPFRDLEAPPKPRQESDWLTPDEFRRLLDAAGRPERNLPGPRRTRPARAAHPRAHGAAALRALRPRLARPRARRPQNVAARPLRERRQVTTAANPSESRASAAAVGQRP